MKIGIVSDRPSLTHVLHRAVSQQPGYHVAWIAEDRAAALEHCASKAPDVALVVLPGERINSVELTEAIMRQSPCPILIVAEGGRANAAPILEALNRGARAVADAPLDGVSGLAVTAAPLLAKIAFVAGWARDRPASEKIPLEAGRPGRVYDTLIVIGASAGGPAAVATVLRGLSPDLAAPIVIVQHLEQVFVSGMASWLSQVCGRLVEVSKDGELIAANRVLLAGADGHLLATAAGRLVYTPEPRHCAYRPSVDVFFDSVSRVWRGDVIGVLLTGMGKDGALGLKALRGKGHHTIAQDQTSSAVYGMPKAAAALNAAVDILPLSRIAGRIDEIARTRAHR